MKNFDIDPIRGEIKIIQFQLIIMLSGIRWGNYVGAPGNDPIICWKHKHKVLISTLVPLSTGDVFGLPVYTALVLAYSKDKGKLNNIL